MRLNYLLEAALDRIVIELALELVPAGTGGKLRDPVDRVGTFATTQVVGLASVHEVLLHVCCHLHLVKL